MEPKITIEPRRHQRRRQRDTDRSTSTDGTRRSTHSQSPPLQSRVVILAKKPNQKPSTPSSPSLLIGSQSATTTPIQSIQIIPSLHSTQHSVNTSNTSIASFSNTGSASTATKLAQMVANANNQSLTDETVTDLMSSMPSVMKLIDSDSLIFLESPANDYLFNEMMSSSGFSVISAVGLEGVGKSSVLNLIANKDVFRVHNNNSNYSERPLKHRTRGIDLHITKERLFLLDSQPLLSASVLDEYLQKSPPHSSSTGVDISEPENYSFMISLQLLSFLLSTCDYIIIVCDYMLDIHLIKLMATAVMMVGDSAHKADIIWYFPNSKTQINGKTIDLLLGRSLYVTVICGDQKELLNAVMKAPTKRIVGENGRNSSHTSEKSWLLSSQRYWETSIRKSSLYSDYGRFLP